METKQLTLNDCNVEDIFTLPGSGSTYRLIDLVDFIDEDSGNVITLPEVIKVSTKKKQYMSFDTVIAKIK